MDTINERIARCIAITGLTRTAFAKRINLSQPHISKIALGESVPSDRTIADICREFNVNETWLRTGEGEMFVQQSSEDELTDMVERLITGESAEFKRRLVRALSALKEEHWIWVEQKLKEIVGMRDTAPTFAPTPIPESDLTLEQEADAFAAMAREQFLAEKRKASQASSVKESDLA